MKVLVYADFRSPHALGWTAGLRDAGLDVVALSSEALNHGTVTGAVAPAGGLASLRAEVVKRTGRDGVLARDVLGLLRRNQAVHTLFAAARLRRERGRLRGVIASEKPDLVHALRIPYEGLTLLGLGTPVPKVVSVWGQDFVKQARDDRLLRHWIRAALPHAAGLHVDNPEDVLRATDSGLDASTPTIHAAGNFGVDETLFFPSSEARDLILCARRPATTVDTNAFIQMVAQHDPADPRIFAMLGISNEHPDLRPVRPWIDAGKLLCFPELERADFAALVQRTRVMISPATSDGMPNTVLEGLAAGCDVIAGDLPQLRALSAQIPSLRLVDLQEPTSLKNAVDSVLLQNNFTLRSPVRLPKQYSPYHNRRAVPEFYERVLEDHTRRHGR